MIEAVNTMQHNSIQGYLEECFTETVFAAAQLKTELWNNKGYPENKLIAFYNAFMQLYSMTFYKLDQKGIKSDMPLQVNVRKWFSYTLPVGMRDRSSAIRVFSSDGIGLFNEWSECLQKFSIIKVGV